MESHLLLSFVISASSAFSGSECSLAESMRRKKKNNFHVLCLRFTKKFSIFYQKNFKNLLNRFSLKFSHFKRVLCHRTSSINVMFNNFTDFLTRE